LYANKYIESILKKGVTENEEYRLKESVSFGVSIVVKVQVKVFWVVTPYTVVYL
jgi:hypothetical protein